MNKFKRCTAAAVIAAVLAFAFLIYPLASAGNASAPEEFIAAADTLHVLGLFLGTDSGYELDRTPTRAEAAVMLVRFLGKEAEANLAVRYSAPFSDVPDWAKPYVGYLYANGITNGVSATEFGSSQLCSVKMYSAFIMRALGYADGMDFIYDTADITVRTLIYSNLTAGNFTRGDMTALSELALASEVKSTSFGTLAEKLASDGAIPANSPYIERAKQYKLVRNAFTQIAETQYYDVSVRYTFASDELFLNADELTAQYHYDAQSGSPEWSYSDSSGAEIIYSGNDISGNLGSDLSPEDFKLSFDLDDELRFFNAFTYGYESVGHIYQLRYGENDFSAVAENILGDEYSALVAQGLHIRSIITEIAVSSSGTLRYQNTMLRGSYLEDGKEVLLNAYEEITINGIE
ncbi:MAG: hypothetical protein LBT88_08320 [Oscillospiraceae bacterium]|jgi:hypothetical protein|nr:hypothetical protein [Oscillospiraceae bacterium]